MAFKFGASSHSTNPHHGHIAQTPSWFFPLRIVQAVLALLTLILSAVALDYFGRYRGEDAYGLNIFTSILTFIFLAYIFVTALKFPIAYNMWAVLGFEIVLVIFWLVTFALLADYASGLGKAEDHGRSYGGRYTNTKYKSASGCTKAAAAFAALEWVTFIVTLVFFSLSLHRHRQTGNPFMPGHAGPTGNPVVPGHDGPTGNPVMPGHADPTGNQFMQGRGDPTGTGTPGSHEMESVTHNQTDGVSEQTYPEMESVTHNQTDGVPEQTYPEQTYPEQTYPEQQYPQQHYPQNTYQSGASGPGYNPNGQQAV